MVGWCGGVVWDSVFRLPARPLVRPRFGSPNRARVLSSTFKREVNEGGQEESQAQSRQEDCEEESQSKEKSQEGNAEERPMVSIEFLARMPETEKVNASINTSFTPILAHTLILTTTHVGGIIPQTISFSNHLDSQE